MEINKLNSQKENYDTVKIGENQKIECKDGECYLVDIDDSDNDSAIIFTENKVSEETDKEELKVQEIQKSEIIKITEDTNIEDLENIKGTTFIVVGGKGCGRCVSFNKILNTLNDNLNGKATMAHLTMPNDNLKESNIYKIYRKFKDDTNTSSKVSHGYPIIIKLVDGKATEFYEYKDYSSFYTDVEKMGQWLDERIENEKEKQEITETEPEEKTENEEIKNVGATEVSNTEDTENSTETKTTNYIKSVLGLNDDEDSEYAKSYLINQVRGARNIKELKKLLFNLEGLEIKLQLEVMDAINEIKFDDDLNSAKSNILNKLK